MTDGDRADDEYVLFMIASLATLAIGAYLVTGSLLMVMGVSTGAAIWAYREGRADSKTNPDKEVPQS